MRAIIAVLLCIVASILFLRFVIVDGSGRDVRPTRSINSADGESRFANSPITAYVPGRDQRDLARRRRVAAQLPIDVAAIAARIEAIIETLDESDLYREMQEWTGIDEEILKAGDVDTRAFARRLLDIATGRDRNRDRDEAPSMLFSSSLDADNGPLEPTTIFTRDDARIHAHIPADSFGRREYRALVRWRNEDSGAIELLQSVFVAGDGGSGYRSFSLREPEGWSLGERRVDIYRLERGAPLIATGRFEVTEAAGSWREATSSLELLAAAEDGPLDSLTSTREAFRVGFRSRDGGGAGPTLTLTRADDAAAALTVPFTPPRVGSSPAEAEASGVSSSSTWWDAGFAQAPFGAGLYVARLERDGILLERLAFRIFDRDANRKKGEER